MFRTWVFIVFVVARASLAADEPAPSPSPPRSLEHAHAHNDYLHKRPLLDALALGFCGVEADIFLIDGKMLVAHTRREIKPDRTLPAIYLEPLEKRVKENGGRVHPGGPAVMLLVDIKNNGAGTYPVLRRELEKHRGMLSVFDMGKFKEGAVTVVISGDRPISLITADPVRYMGIDGRLGDLDSDAPASLMPLISDNWLLHFRWRGKGPIPPPEKQKLKDIVAKTHAKGRRLRFWGTSENEALWTELLDAGVDYIGTDDLPRLARFLSNREAPKS